jgi:cation:H+ antiporter
MMDWILVVVGLVMLLIGGDTLVRGAVALAKKLGIPTLIVSLTVVAFGTSAPELLIAIQAALDGVPELALGNVIGSNTANVLLVLGVPAILTGLHCTDEGSKQNFFYVVGVSVFFIAIAFTQPLFIWQGIALLAVLALVLYSSYRAAQTSRAKREELESEVDDTDIETWKMVAFLIVGMILLPLGAKFLIDGAVNISTAYGVSEAVIGLTLVALGTSLPELATTVMAGYRREGDVAFGNVLGSNIFNLLAIIGVACFFGPLPVNAEFFKLDLWIMLATTLMMAPFVVWRLPMKKAWGILFVVCYLTYIFMLLNQ